MFGQIRTLELRNFARIRQSDETPVCSLRRETAQRYAGIAQVCEWFKTGSSPVDHPAAIGLAFTPGGGAFRPERRRSGKQSSRKPWTHRSDRHSRRSGPRGCGGSSVSPPICLTAAIIVISIDVEIPIQSCMFSAILETGESVSHRFASHLCL